MIEENQKRHSKSHHKALFICIWLLLLLNSDNHFIKQWRTFPAGHTPRSAVFTISILSDQLRGYRSYLAQENIYEPHIVW